MEVLKFIQFPRTIVPIQADTVFFIGNFPVKNTTLSLVAITLFIAFSAFYFRNRISVDSPGKLQSFFELVYEALKKQILSVTASDYHARRIFPLIATIFIFVGLSNYLGLVPGLGSITYNGVNVFRTATSDFNTTFALALGTLIVFHLITLNDFGPKGYFLKFIPLDKLREDIKKGKLALIYIFVTLLVAILDIIGEFAKIVSVSLRLFGNMYAGEVLTGVLVGLVAFVLPSFWVLFGLLGALVQTIVFGSLVTVFYMQSAGDTAETSQNFFGLINNNLRKIFIWK